jgi:exosortase
MKRRNRKKQKVADMGEEQISRRLRRDQPPSPGPSATPKGPLAVLAASVVAATFAWAYWPTLVILVRTWNREPDYSHGYLVVPLAVFFLWARRQTFPGFAFRLAWPGLVLLLVSVVLRFLSGRYSVDPVDGWSIVVWVAGVVWLFAGWRVLWWSWPSLTFLLFMIPLPFRAERSFSLPLQRIATKLSSWTLQCLGQPAIVEGNTIWLNDMRLEVERACSGLRIFMAVVALAFVYLVLFRRPWWQRVLLALSTVPIALVANMTRIVATGLVGQYISGEAAHKLNHDAAGWLMIPFAALLFAFVLWYVDRLVREVEVVDVGTIVRQAAE